MSATSPSQGFTLPEDFNPWNTNHCYSIRQLNEAARAKGANPQAARQQKKSGLTTIKKEPDMKKTFVLAAQSFHKNYVFNYNGGQVYCYDIEVAIEGDKATISNFFNLAAQSTEWSVGVDMDVEGVYDAEAKTITIPTSDVFEEATIAGTIGDSYTEMLVAGTVNETGQFAPDDELVLYIDGDFDRIYAKQNIASMHWFTSLNMSFGMQVSYRTFEAFALSEEPKILSYNTSFDFGEAFVDSEATVTATYVNVSTKPVDYAVSVECDGDAYTSDPAAGEAPAKSAFDVNYKFHPMSVGDFEGIATINYDGINETPQPIVTLLNGVAKDYPDYSAIVKEGDFTFTTNIEYPFAIAEDAEGNTVARSTVNGSYGSSKLTVNFEVPEGKVGTLSWKGKSYNVSDWYKNASGYFIDDNPNPDMKWTGPDDDISGTIKFVPGKHSIRFQYDGLYYTGDEKNHMTVYDLSLVNTDAPADAAEVSTPEVYLGSFVIKDDAPTATGTGTIRMRNLGSNELKVNSITSDNSFISGTVPANTVGLLQYLDIPVNLEANQAGNVEATLTINTSAGTFTAKVSALVRQLADIKPFIIEGADLVTAIEQNEQNPFEINGTQIINANSGLKDDAYSDSYVRIRFTVPEGKAARLYWKGHNYGGVAEGQYSGDYGAVEFSHPMVSGTMCFWDYDTDAGSDAVAANSSWADQLVCVPGDHYIAFHYYKNGDGFISEEDRAEFSDLRIVLEDFNEYGVQPDVEEVVFRPTYVGDNRYTTATINLRNTGSQILKVTDANGDLPFYPTFRETDQCNWNQTIQVGIWFYPSEEGKFEGDVVFETTAGPVTIHCIGETYSAEGTLLIGDFEDAAQGWSIYDADRDGSCWNLGYNLWGSFPEWVHSGEDCLASPSQGTSGEALAPDNWTFSPGFVMPEDGKAMLSWWVAAHHHERYAEHYSAYFGTFDELSDPENLDNLTAIHSETLNANDADEWRQVTAQLEGTPGETYAVAFRHHDCSGEYVLKLDDVFVYTMDRWYDLSSVLGVGADSNVVRTEIYDINGIRLNAPTVGINIVTKVYNDGRRETRKVFVTK